MNKLRLRRGEILGAAGVLAVAFSATVGSLSAQSTAEKVRVAGVPTEDATNMYYAVKTGLFQRAGLDIEMVDTSSGTAAVAAMVSGTYEMARPSMLSMVLAHAKGIGVSIVSAANAHDTHQPLALLQVAADSTIRTGADLNGKIIGVPALNDINSIAIRAWSEKNGGDWHSLKFVEIPNTLLEGALAAHRIDAAVLQSPYLWSSLDAHSTKTIGDAWGAIAPRFIIGVNVARTDWFITHRDVVRRFVRVYYAAAKYVNTHPAETAAYVVELTKIELPTVQKMHRAVVPTELKINEIQPVIDAAARYGVIPQAFAAKEML